MTFDNNIPTKFPSLDENAPSGSDLLSLERCKASFEVQKLTEFMYTKAWLEKRDRVLAVIERDPGFSKDHRYYQSRDARLKSGYNKDKRIIELAKEHQWGPEERRVATFLYDQSTPFSLHHGMFIPTLMNQTTDEQKRLFLEPALKYEILGCYAQTELGHGSNVQGLETTATYISSTNEFELHSPSLTSAKWWIGGLGKTATHAIVMARLLIHGKDHGPHPFCVQIRSLKNHCPLEGITVGDIGPKFGFNAVDNGFLLFDHCIVPHVSFLAGHTQVVPGSGDYIRPPNTKLSYGTMVYVRANIVMGVRFALAKAATISIRYSAVRQQFVDPSNVRMWDKNTAVETPVLDYTMQQYRLLPILASAYACFFTGREMMRLYEWNQEEMKKGRYDLLADVHASSSGLKSLTTTMAVEAIEDCRRACGGHGYSLFSGLGLFYQDYLPNTTWEGDNYVLTQQTARYLLKTYRQLLQTGGGPRPDDQQHNITASYLWEYLHQPTAKCTAMNPIDLQHPELILAAFKYRAAYGVAQVVVQLDRHGKSWNAVLVELQRISRAHCQYLLIHNFFAALQSDPLLSSSEYRDIHKVLRSLACLLGLHMMEKDSAEFMVCGYLSITQCNWVKEQVMVLLCDIRPQAIPLVDAFDLPDYYLHSALGRYDGKVYKAITEMAEMEPLNHSVVVDSYASVIRPLVSQGWTDGLPGQSKL